MGVGVGVGVGSRGGGGGGPLLLLVSVSVSAKILIRTRFQKVAKVVTDSSSCTKTQMLGLEFPFSKLDRLFFWHLVGLTGHS